MPCLSPEQLADFVAGEVDAETREAMIEHLSVCSDCRRGLVEASPFDLEAAERVEMSPALLDTVRKLGRRPPEPRSLAWAWPLAAALLMATGLGLVTFGPGGGVFPKVGDGLRSTVEGGGVFEVLEPAAGSTLGTEPVTLRWTELPTARRYTVTVVDGLGNILLRQTLSEPRWTLDPVVPELGETPGELFWYVTAELEDFTDRETTPRELRRSP